MMDCSTCSSDPKRTLTLLHKLDVLCTLYVAGQAKFTASDNLIGKRTSEECAVLSNSTFQIGRFVLDSEECQVVGRVVVKQGLDNLQKKLQAVQAEQKRANCGTAQEEIGAKARRILTKVWGAGAYGCL